MKITLCGSTRFQEEFVEWNGKLTLAGHIVYSLGVFGRQASDVGKENHVTYTDAQKQTLDLVHLNKILNSDAIVVINPDDYIGSSTAREIEWAKMQRKYIYYLEVNERVSMMDDNYRTPVRQLLGIFEDSHPL